MNDIGGPRIYVACLAAYNNGHLHGEWIDASQEIDQVWAQINAILAASPIEGAEEFAIHDHDGFLDLHLGEYETIEHVHLIAVGIAEHGRAFAVWASLLDRAEWDDGLDQFEDHFEGVYESYEAFGEQILDMCGIDPDNLGLPDMLDGYIIIEVGPLGRDWASGMLTAWSNGQLYVFFQ